jgi:hypothetical protein
VHLLLLALRLIHIVGGIIWVGFGIFLPSFLAPVLAGLGADGGKVMAGLQRRGLMTMLPLIALATILSGAGLFWWVSEGRLADFIARPMGLALATGALFAVVAFFLGVLIARPSVVRIGATLQRQASATPEEREEIQATVAQLQRRVVSVGRWTTTLLLLAAGAMAVARYL